MSFGSMKLTHADGTMHHLGIDETMVAKRVLLTPDPLQVPFYAALMDKAEKVGEYREYVTYTGTLNGKPLSVMSCGFGCHRGGGIEPSRRRSHAENRLLPHFAARNARRHTARRLRCGAR